MVSLSLYFLPACGLSPSGDGITYKIGFFPSVYEKSNYVSSIHQPTPHSKHDLELKWKNNPPYYYDLGFFFFFFCKMTVVGLQDDGRALQFIPPHSSLLAACNICYLQIDALCCCIWIRMRNRLIGMWVCCMTYTSFSSCLMPTIQGKNANRKISENLQILKFLVWHSFRESQLNRTI